MSQTSYNINQGAAILGMLADSGFKHTEGKVAKGAIPVGRGVCKVIGKDDQVRLPAANQGSLVFDADFVTDNDIDLKINGVAITTVEFDTDHDTTVAALATEIASNADVDAAVVDPADTDSRTIVVTGVDETIIEITDVAVTNGASQAGGTWTNGTRDTLYGVAQLTQILESGLPGEDTDPEYADEDVVNVLRRGSIYVTFETAFDPDSDTLYCRFIAGGATELIGQFRNDTDSGKAFAVSGNVQVKSTLTSGGLGIVELNRPV